MEKTDDKLAVPAIAGLAVGIAFVVAFSLFAGHSSASQRMMAIENKNVLFIEGLKGTYGAGEQIAFSVNAKGISDNLACNSLPPAVAIRDDGNGKEIKLNPIRFSTALLCTEPRPFDKEWTFGDKPDEKIVLDKAGSYTVVASLEDVTVEKKFSVL